MNKEFKNIIPKPEIKQYVQKSMDIADQIQQYLEEKGLSQKEFAEKIGKSESEISKWLSGDHNFTVKTITKIEAVLEVEIILVPMYLHEYLSVQSIERVLISHPENNANRFIGNITQHKEKPRFPKMKETITTSMPTYM